MNDQKWYQNKWLLVVLVAILAFAGGSATGFFGKPAEIREKRVEVEKEKLVYVEKTLSQEELNRLVDEAVKKKTHKTWVVTKKPDGTVVKTGTETTETDSTKKEVVVETKIVYVDKFIDRIVEKRVEVEKIVKNQPNWLVHAGVGAAVPTLLGKPELGVPGLRGAVIEAGVARKVVGPFYLGLYGNTQGTVGLNLTGAF